MTIEQFEKAKEINEKFDFIQRQLNQIENYESSVDIDNDNSTKYKTHVPLKTFIVTDNGYHKPEILIGEEIKNQIIAMVKEYWQLELDKIESEFNNI
jgi:hypothetical protein